MEIDYKVVIGLLAIAITLWGYYYYLRDIFQGKTKPHIFSWFIWAILTGVGFVIQFNDNAGPGAWITLTSAIFCGFVTVLAFKYGEKHITKSDTFAFIGSIIAIIIWLLLDNPLLSLIIIIVIDTLSFYPTFRKSWNKPQEETLIHYSFASLKFLLAIIALNNFSLLTVLYPLSLVIANGAFVIMVIFRKKALGLK